MSVDEDMLYESLHESWDEIDELRAENKKLRVLVVAFDWCIKYDGCENGCHRCPLPKRSKSECECEILMRELGVKV